MQIVIDIPEEEYDKFNKSYLSYTDYTEYGRKLLSRFREGHTLLPKGHGRLIDADYLKDVILLHNFRANDKYFVPYSDRKGYRLRDREVTEAIINAPTIIEADKGAEE